MLFTGSYYVTLERRFIVEIDLIQVRLMVMCQIDTTADNLWKLLENDGVMRTRKEAKQIANYKLRLGSLCFLDWDISELIYFVRVKLTAVAWWS